MDFVNDKDFWTQRYLDQKTGWDIGHVSTPIKEYIDQLADKLMRILIPGAGNAHEAEYLFEQGFENVYVLDISKLPLQAFLERTPNFPKMNVLLGDFFELEGTFDLILEQTFFCALAPNKRPAYVQQMCQLLDTGGKVVGLLFNFPLTEKGPPFGGTIQEYRTHFMPYFNIEILETAYNSIQPRSGAELFIKLVKK